MTDLVLFKSYKDYIHETENIYSVWMTDYGSAVIICIFPLLYVVSDILVLYLENTLSPKHNSRVGHTVHEALKLQIS